MPRHLLGYHLGENRCFYLKVSSFLLKVAYGNCGNACPWDKQEHQNPQIKQETGLPEKTSSGLLELPESPHDDKVSSYRTPLFF